MELEWAEDLAGRLSETFGEKVGALEMIDENLAGALEKADILVNATSVGMSPSIDETPVPIKLLKPGLVIFDIVYNPIKTRLQREAEQIGAKTISGIDMLVWQGALAFEKWTGVEAPIELMKKEVIRIL